MRPTHQARIANHEDVTAWQFSHNKPIPIWVARVFHQTEGTGPGSKWTAMSPHGVVEAKEGDWAVAVNVGICIVLTNKEFQECFKPL